MQKYCKVIILRPVCLSVCLSVRPHGITWLPLDGFSSNLIFAYFFENVPRKFKFHLKLTRITDTLHEHQYTCLIIPRSFHRMRNISDKNCRWNENTHFGFNNFFCQNCAIFLDNVKEYGRNWQPTYDNVTWSTRFPCWITNATDKHSEYVMFCMVHFAYINRLNTTIVGIDIAFLCITSRFMIIWMLLYVALYVHFLSFQIPYMYICTYTSTYYIYNCLNRI